jgi:hypothetical protein
MFSVENMGGSSDEYLGYSGISTFIGQCGLQGKNALLLN